MSDEARTAAVTRGAIRGLTLSLEEREAKLAAAPPHARELLEQEIAALQWIQVHYWVYKEQGTWPDVVAFLEGDGAAEAEAA